MRSFRIGLTDALRMLPDFCWLSYSEIIAYLEQINDNIEEDHVGPSLAKLVAGGEILMKCVDAPLVRRHGMGSQIRMYRTVAWPSHVKTLFRALIAVETARSIATPDVLPFYVDAR